MTASNAAVFTPRPSPALRWSGIGLVGASWMSASAFGLYILAFYLGNFAGGHAELWNNNLDGLYEKGNLTSLAGMAAHLAAGAVVLLLGPVQFIAAVRSRWPWVHRWIGRVYVATCGLAGLGGLVFIAAKGTIGGLVMNIGFGLYGALMVLAATQAWRYAAARRFELHRAWATRLFALAVGSWLYRMDYGFWLLAMHRIGHREDFRGPFDIVMAFFFYLPNLAVAELYLHAGWLRSHTAVRAVSVILLNAATLIVAVGTYYFLRFYWGPGIVGAFLPQGQ
jgi:hypothetical protein